MRYTLCVPGILLLLGWAKAMADGRNDFAYVEMQLRIVGAEGQPVEGAKVYGFCADYGLVWPRFRHDQDAQVWCDPPEAMTDAQGKIAASVPKGVWRFVAAGRIQKNGRVTLLLNSTDPVEVSGPQTIQLTPRAEKAVPISATHLAGEGARLVECALANGSPFIPVDIPSDGERDVSLPDDPELEAMLVFRENNTGTAMVGIVKPALARSSDKTLINASATIEIQQSTEQVTLRRFIWESLRPGCKGALDGQGLRQIRFQPGEYMLSYEVNATDDSVVRFGPRLFNLESGKTLVFEIGAKLRAGIEEQHVEAKGNQPEAFLGMLHVTDSQGLMAWSWMNPRGRTIPLDGTLELANRRVLALEQQQRHGTHAPIFYVPPDDIQNARRVKERRWLIHTPLENVIGSRFERVAMQRLQTPYFSVECASLVAPTMQGFLTLAGQRRLRLADVCGRRIRTTITLEMPPHGGGWGMHDGSRIGISNMLLTYDRPDEDATFCHELTHSAGYYHTPVMGLVIELARDQTLSGQMAKWLFFDRMNRLNVSMRYPVELHDDGIFDGLGIYFLLHCRHADFTKQISEYEVYVLGETDKKRIPRSAALAALTSRVVGYDTEALWRDYGYTIQKEDREQADRIVNRLLQDRQ